MRFAVVLLLTSCAPHVDTRRIARELLEDWNAKDPEHPLQEVQVFPFQGVPDHYLAICDHQPGWWGSFTGFTYRDGRFEEFSGGGDPNEQSIREVRGFHLAGHPYPLVEVFGMTHMGNGSLYLYELRGRDLQLLLETRAVDWHQDLNLFRGGRLSVAYRDLDQDGHFDLEFRGVVEEYPETGDVPTRSYPCRKVFLWTRDRFVEDPAQRRGFETYSN